MTELTNGVKVFSQLFGDYPYPQMNCMFHPRPYGQSLPTMVFLAPTDERTNKFEFAFVAHEVSHQWWGDLVGWRTYRDQWISEGFAEYSGALYTALRMNEEAKQDLIRRSRALIAAPPLGEAGGVRRGRVADLGPIVLGHRLANRETYNGYTTLIYQKGALILRMLHFLLSDPSTGDDQLFYSMMREFVNRHRHQSATTESLAAVASEF